MRLLEAIKLTRKVPTDSPEILLVSSFETEWLESYLMANFVLSQTPKKVLGTEFGNIFITLARLDHTKNKFDSIIISIDWEDLIPGSSFRSGAKIPDLNNVDLSCIAAMAEHIKQLTLNQNCPIVIVPPVVLSVLQLSAQDMMYSLGQKETGDYWNLFLDELKELSVPNNLIIMRRKEVCLNELDCNLLFRGGWGLSSTATNELAQNIVNVLKPRNTAIKLIIVDLDDTLWSGTVGESGVSNVNWDASEDGFKHLLFQRMLFYLGKKGVLLAVCSKNERNIADQALKRQDMIIPHEMWVSIKAGWHQKSEMVNDILSDLNLLESAFLFIDNSKFEVEEVRRKFQLSSYLVFPENNKFMPDFTHKLLSQFSFERTTNEDRIRVQSYRARARVLKEINSCDDISKYLKDLGMCVQFSFVEEWNEDRPLQLVNKTNQFNLNGKRETVESWKKYFENSSTNVMKVHLKDKFSNHGNVSVIILEKVGVNLEVLSWVLSCRVFSRKLEDAIMDCVTTFATEICCKNVVFKFKETPKNKSLQEWIFKNTSLMEDYHFKFSDGELPYLLSSPFESRFVGKCTFPKLRETLK